MPDVSTAKETPAAPVAAPAVPAAPPAAPSARPVMELVKRRRGSMIRKLERRGMALQMRAMPDGTGGTDFQFTGYGSVFDAPFEMWDTWGDQYTEVVRQGAFTRSLAAAPDVPFLIGHNDADIPLARTRNGTMTLHQDPHGLLVEARMDGSRSDVRNLASAVERGDLDEMSIGFWTLGQEWSPDWETRALTDLELNRGDVSAVAVAANPATAGASMMALPVGEILRSSRPAEQRAQDEVVDTSKQPDFNLPDQDPANDGQGAKPCPHGAKNGCKNMCPGSDKFCGSCGGPLYQSDGAMVLDDSGVVEEVQGASGDADLRMATRMLELA